MTFEKRIREMVNAVERGDGEAVAACFTTDGIYHDVFYGDFKGADIARMINEYFYRDADDFRWDIHDAVEQGARGYARYVFSYRPKQAQTADDQPSRTMFEGVAICRMENGLIADYAEIANAAVGLHGMGFPPQRLAKFIAKQSGELKARSESRRHID